MKKLLIVLLSFTWLSTLAQFTPSDVGRVIRGYAVTQKGDTVTGTLKVFEQYEMQISVPNFIVDDKSKEFNEDMFYSCYNTICYELDKHSKWYSTKFTVLEAPKDPKRVGEHAFLLVKVEGPITVYTYNLVDNLASPPTNESPEYLRLPNGEIITASSLILGFKKKMADIVKDYPELATKINNKEKGYGMLGIYDIVREYNKWYMEKNPGFTILKK